MHEDKNAVRLPGTARCHQMFSLGRTAVVRFHLEAVWVQLHLTSGEAAALKSKVREPH